MGSEMCIRDRSALAPLRVIWPLVPVRFAPLAAWRTKPRWEREESKDQAGDRASGAAACACPPVRTSFGIARETPSVLNVVAGRSVQERCGSAMQCVLSCGEDRPVRLPPLDQPRAAIAVWPAPPVDDTCALRARRRQRAVVPPSWRFANGQRLLIPRISANAAPPMLKGGWCPTSHR